MHVNWQAMSNRWGKKALERSKEARKSEESQEQEEEELQQELQQELLPSFLTPFVEISEGCSVLFFFISIALSFQD